MAEGRIARAKVVDGDFAAQVAHCGNETG
jgi:hypothetical protein